MILAAGRGERLRPLTDSMPKPLVEVGGKPLIAWHIERLRAAGVRDLVVNVSWLASQLRAYLGDGSHWGVSIQISEEPPGALDTGGGIAAARPLLGDDPFWVVNGDVFTDFDFNVPSLGAHDLAHVVLVEGPSHDFALAGHRVANAGAPMLTFAGVGLYRPQLFDDGLSGAFSLTPLLREAATRQCLRGSRYAGVWHDSGTPERLARLRETFVA